MGAVQTRHLLSSILTLSTALIALPGCAELPDDATATDELTATSATADPIATWCPGIDRAAGVPNYRGLAGTYRRVGVAAATEPYQLSLAPTVDTPDADGSFTGYEAGATGWPVRIAGHFHALPDNPAIGAALWLDLGNDDSIDRTYFVLGLRRSASGATITALCLQGPSHPGLYTRSL